MDHCISSEAKSFNFSFFFLNSTENINKSEKSTKIFSPLIL